MLAIILALPALVVHHNDIAPSNALKLRGGVALDTKTLNTINGLYHVGFGAALYADPNAFADSGASPIKYTADAEGPVGAFTKFQPADLLEGFRAQTIHLVVLRQASCTVLTKIIT